MLTIAENLSAEERAQLDSMRTAENESDASPQADSGAAAQSPSGTTPAQEEGQDAQSSDSAGSQPPAEPKMVDIRSLHEERARAKEYRDQLAEERRRMQLLEERTNLLLQRYAQSAQPQVPAEPPKPAIPTLQEDPVNHILARLDETQHQVQRYGQGTYQYAQEVAQQQQQAQQLQNFVARAQALENEFKAEKPDYEDAFTHLNKQRASELSKIGVRDPAERMRIIQQQNLAIADIAMQNGQNPAQVLYELAQDRGYAPGSSPGSPVRGQPDDPGQDQKAAGQRLEQIAAGQQQARSIGNMRGTAPPPMTVQRLLEMDGDEFLKMIKTPQGKALLGA
jgi:hypothetical protein